jgi:polyphenol oxidase
VYCGGVDAATTSAQASASPPGAGASGPPPTAGLLRTRGGLPVLAWPALDTHPVDVIVTTRRGGVSAGPWAELNLGLHTGDDPDRVRENRRRAAAALGAGPGDVVWARQPHGRGVAVVTAADRGRGAWSEDDAIPGADALVTVDPGVILAIMVADCVPIALWDPAAGVLACVHAGWRGTVARVTDAALAAMGTLGARPAASHAMIGPAIGQDRYQVGPEVAAAVRDGLGATADRVLAPDGPGHWRLDLPAASHALLREAGVPAGQIHPAGQGTSAAGPFYSYRAGQPAGRFALLARIRTAGQR